MLLTNIGTHYKGTREESRIPELVTARLSHHTEIPPLQNDSFSCSEAARSVEDFVQDFVRFKQNLWELYFPLANDVASKMTRKVTFTVTLARILLAETLTMIQFLKDYVPSLNAPCTAPLSTESPPASV